MILSTHCEILHPHLIVYLDSPVNEIEKRIKEKHGQIPPALATKFLETLNNRYKYGYLPEIRWVYFYKFDLFFCNAIFLINLFYLLK